MIVGRTDGGAWWREIVVALVGVSFLLLSGRLGWSWDVHTAKHAMAVVVVVSLPLMLPARLA